MTAASLPPRQFQALAYLSGHGPATVQDVARALRVNSTEAGNALRLLAGKGLAAADDTAVPRKYSVTEAGEAEVAAARLAEAEGGER